MIQAHQPSSEIDNWPFYEFQLYVDILNKRNKEKEAQNNQNKNTSTEKSSGIMNSISKMANKFKKP